MDGEADSWLSNSDAMILFRETRDYVLREMEGLEGESFARVAPHPSAPLTALKHNLRRLISEQENLKLRRIASNGFLLMGFSAFEYSLSQSLQVFFGAKSKDNLELNFTQSSGFLRNHSCHSILKTREWRLMESLQNVRHAIAHRGSIVQLSDNRLKPLRDSFAPIIAQPLFEDGDLRDSKEHSEADLAARARRSSYLTFRRADLELTFDFSERILRNLVASKPGVA